VTHFDSNELRELISSICKLGAKPIVVGGAVRDHLMGQGSADIDIEVFNVPIQDVATHLSGAFNVKDFNKSFGVFKLQIGSQEFDISSPRREVKQGVGHKGFHVELDPFLTFDEAALRRDFTINSIGFDPISETILDPYNGVRDIKHKVLRHISPSFKDDPLRALRACQFAGRFGFRVAHDTAQQCWLMRDELQTLSPERIWAEVKSLLLKSPKPSDGLNAMLVTGVLDIFPELKLLVGVPHDPIWHPEGDVWLHNCMVVDGAVRVLKDDNVTDEYERLVVLLGALCHDLGKPLTTEFVDERWRSHKHDTVGDVPTTSFLNRIGASSNLIDDVIPLVVHHLKPFQLFSEKASVAAVRRLAVKVSLVRLCRVARADFLGRTTPDAMNCKDSRTIPNCKWLMDMTQEINAIDGAPTPILKGRHMLSLGMPPGPSVGSILERAFEAQLDGVFSTEDEAIEWAKGAIKIYQ